MKENFDTIFRGVLQKKLDKKNRGSPAENGERHGGLIYLEPPDLYRSQKNGKKKKNKGKDKKKRNTGGIGNESNMSRTLHIFERLQRIET